MVAVEKIAKVFRPDYDWMHGLPNKDLLINPLVDITEDERERDELTEFYKLCNPFYSPVFGMKYLLGAKLFPFQMSMLLAMLKHKFPLLLLTRGGGKCVSGNTLCLTGNGMLRIDEMITTTESQTVFNESHNVFNGKRVVPTKYSVCNGMGQTKRLTLGNGLTIEGTPEHRVKVIEDEASVWKRLDEIATHDVVEMYVGTNQFGSNESLSIDECYFAGIMIGDGCLTQDNLILFSSKDQELLNAFYQTCESLGYKAKHRGKHSKYDHVSYGVGLRQELKDRFDLGKHLSYDKQIPRPVREGDKNRVIAFIQGLFDTDGGMESGRRATLCSVSIRLIEQVQCALLNLGIESRVRTKNTKSRFGKAFILTIQGEDLDLFYRLVGFRLSRKSQQLESCVGFKRNTNTKTFPFKNLAKRCIRQLFSETQSGSRLLGKNRICPSRIDLHGLTKKVINRILEVALQEQYHSSDIERLLSIVDSSVRYCKVKNVEDASAITYDFNIPDDNCFVSNGMLSHNTYILATYALYHAIMFPYSRIILVSASFRQSKLIFQEMERMIKAWPLLRHIMDRDPLHTQDHWKIEICGSSITALPMGDGSKIRGERGHVIIADEFDSIDIETFNVVVRGFAATQLDPWEATKSRILGHTKEDRRLADVNSGNKIILAGTAGFVGGTLHTIYSDYRKIIANNVRGTVGDYDELFEIDGRRDLKIDCGNYCIMTYKYDELPLMELEIVEANRAQMPQQLFDMEYRAIFADDSQGFFKAKYIRAATSKPPNGFSVLKVGSAKRSYVMGVDPAKALDRFAITLIEVGSPHKVVYQWTAQGDKYSDCAAHMRELCRRFHVVGICMDHGGGGLSVEEMVNMEKTEDGRQIKKPEEVRWSRFDDDSPEGKEGLPILHLQVFASNWLDESNTLLQKNIEDKMVMFPMPTSNNAMDDEGEDILYEISEMKKELISIGITYTRTGKKSFDLKPPGPKEEGSKHKDRYSSLLLANFMASRLEQIQYDEQEFLRRKYQNDDTTGGYVEEF